ncbi:MAG: hypothetical protein R2713_15780 [Ilumatobacteraceae bacterium]
MSYRRARIPAGTAAEFVDRLRTSLLEFASAPRGGDREYGLLVGLFLDLNWPRPLPTGHRHRHRHRHHD